jgi:hypothetical protein
MVIKRFKDGSTYDQQVQQKFTDEGGSSIAQHND